MPLIEVKLYDRRVTEESVPRMIDALTKALAETSKADPSHIQVVIQGVDPKLWGIAGKQQS
jgi:4-oxalocrotonate tautomerase